MQTNRGKYNKTTHSPTVLQKTASSCSNIQTLDLLWICLQQNSELNLILSEVCKSIIISPPPHTLTHTHTPHPYFITANKEDMHLGPLFKSGLLADTTCTEKAAIHMQIWARQSKLSFLPRSLSLFMYHRFSLAWAASCWFSNKAITFDANNLNLDL